jgi:hypothetical protein
MAYGVPNIVNAPHVETQQESVARALRELGLD